MQQIRTRIREKRGTDYTQAELQQLASAKLEQFADPSGLRSDLLEQFRKRGDEPSTYHRHRGIRRVLLMMAHPILKRVQKQLMSDLNLYFEIIHNLVVEVTRLGIEVQNLKMRVESLSSRVDFDERRARVARRRRAVPDRPDRAPSSAGSAGAAGSQVRRFGRFIGFGRSSGSASDSSSGSTGSPGATQSRDRRANAAPAATCGSVRTAGLAGSGPAAPVGTCSRPAGPGRQHGARRRLRASSPAPTSASARPHARGQPERARIAVRGQPDRLRAHTAPNDGGRRTTGR